MAQGVPGIGTQQPGKSPMRLKDWLSRPTVTAHVMGYLFLLPALLVMGLFVFYPIIRGLPLAFTDYSVVGDTHWVGLKNFRVALGDSSFRKAFLHSVEYLIVVPVIQLLAILLAALVNRELPAIRFFRTAYYVPVVTSMVAVAIIWKWMYQEQGLVNWVLQSLHIIRSPVSWLADMNTALPALMMVTLYKGLGYYMVIYLAGLQSIPKEVDEAAQIDGASRFDVLRHITMPLLQPFILLCSIISSQGALAVFDEVITMTNGGPSSATLTTSLYSFNVAFKAFEFGRAAAIGLLAGSISWVLTIFMFKVFRGRGQYSL